MAKSKAQYSSRHSTDECWYEDYWSEYNSIKKTGSALEHHDADDVCRIDDIEVEIEWLINTGFDFLLPYLQEGKDEPLINGYEDAISTLTTKQAAAVKKRVSTYKGTLRQKNNMCNPPDVRDVFPQDESSQQRGGGIGSGFHCQIENDNSTQITIGAVNTPSSSVQLRNRAEPIVNSRQEVHDSGKSIYHVSDSQLIDAKYLQVVSKNDAKRNSFPEILYNISSHKQEYSVKDHQLPAKSAEVNNDSFTEKFTYNGELHPSAMISMCSDKPPDTAYKDNKSGLVNDFVACDKLPDICLEDDDCGITYLSDLCSSDLVKVRQLSLIEVTALFDTLNISYNHRKMPRKKSKANVFGASLNAIIAQERKRDSSCKVPKIIPMLISHVLKTGLDEKGILRVPGSFAKTEALRHKIESQYFTNLDVIQKLVSNSSARDCAALLKHFLRDLFEPLLTNAYLEAFLQVQNIPNVILQVKVLNLLILSLPDVHRDVLRCILIFLEKIISYEHINSMNSHNVAMIMAPNLFLPKVKKGLHHGADDKMNLEDEMQFARVTCQVTELIIKYFRLLWMVPTFLLKQVRLQNEAIRDKRANKDHKHKRKKAAEKAPPIENEETFSAEAPITLIKVSTSMPKVGVFCPLNDSLKAGDVVLTVINEVQAKSAISKPSNSKNRPRSVSQLGEGSRPCLLVAADKQLFIENHALCEVGGNIGERKLPHNAKVAAVLKENPLAEWVVKCYHHYRGDDSDSLDHC